MSHTLTLTLLLTFGSSIVTGLAFDAPKATLEAIDWGRGWSPAPTGLPNTPAELVRRNLLEGRQFASTILEGQDQTCGYLNGNAGAAYTCGGLTSTCNLLPPSGTQSWGALACCAGGACYGRLYCINSADYASGKCNDDCAFNTFTLKCTASTAPYCNTAVWPKESVRDVYCAVRSVSSTQTIYTTYSGQTFGGSFTPRVLDDSTSSSRPTSTRSLTSTSSSSSSSSTRAQGPQTTGTNGPSVSPVPIPAESKSTPIGAIVGGVVGGVAVLALIAFGIWFMKRRNRKDKAAAIDSHANQPPPVYLPSQPEIDGTGIVGKPAMTQTQQSYAGAFVPAGSKMNDYQNQQPQPQQQYQQPYNHPEAVSPGTAGGTFDPRRDSTLSPVSPDSYNGSVGGSPQMVNRESYVSTGFPHPPPPSAGAGPEIHEMPGHAAHEMPASNIGRKPVGGNRSGVSNAT